MIINLINLEKILSGTFSYKLYQAGKQSFYILQYRRTVHWHFSDRLNEKEKKFCKWKKRDRKEERYICSNWLSEFQMSGFNRMKCVSHIPATCCQSYVLLISCRPSTCWLSDVPYFFMDSSTRAMNSGSLTLLNCYLHIPNWRLCAVFLHFNYFWESHQGVYVCRLQYIGFWKTDGCDKMAVSLTTILDKRKNNVLE